MERKRDEKQNTQQWCINRGNATHETARVSAYGSIQLDRLCGCKWSAAYMEMLSSPQYLHLGTEHTLVSNVAHRREAGCFSE